MILYLVIRAFYSQGLGRPEVTSKMSIIIDTMLKIIIYMYFWMLITFLRSDLVIRAIHSLSLEKPEVNQNLEFSVETRVLEFFYSSETRVLALSII